MSFSQRQADPRRHLVEFTSLTPLHVLIVHAPVAGLAAKVGYLLRAPGKLTVLNGALRRAVCAGIGSTSAPLTSVCI